MLNTPANGASLPLAAGRNRFVHAIALLCTIAFMSSPALAKESAVDNYRTYCTQCHGLQGNGKGVNVRDMSVQPRDHTDAKAMAGRSDEDLFKVIKEGGLAIDKSVLMPPWGDTFSDEEIHELVQHMRTLCKCKYGKGG
jgi:cytochrome c oxidase cbb3-type subunit 3